MALPTTARIEFKAHSSERLDGGIPCHSLFAPVALELSSNEVFRVQRRKCAKHLNLLVSDGVAIQSGGSLHGQKTDHLKHVILDHIPDCSCGIVELSSTLKPEFFGHCDLHALDIISIPDRLQKAIGEAKEQEIEEVDGRCVPTLGTEN
jgi:hypothetical protein